MTTIEDSQPTPAAYYRHLNQHKFTIELELLSSLASPAYLTNLYTQGVLNDAAFIRYLAHLIKNWSAPQYVRFIRFPMALTFGRALCQSSAFRQIVGTDGWEHQVTHEMIAAWAGKFDQEQDMAEDGSENDKGMINVQITAPQDTDDMQTEIPSVKQEG